MLWPTGSDSPRKLGSARYITEGTAEFLTDSPRDCQTCPKLEGRARVTGPIPAPEEGSVEKKAVIYARVCTPDQHVETQLYQFRELALPRGFEVVHGYMDVGVSGARARLAGPCDSAAVGRKVAGRRCGRASGANGNGTLELQQANSEGERA